MNNTELNLDQLQTINGGRVIAGNAGPGGSTFMTEKTGANPGQMLSPLSGGDGCAGF